MVDIAMCKRKDCKKKWTCFRYIAYPSEFQTYLVPDVNEDVDNGCNMYWRCRDKKELKEMNRLNEGYDPEDIERRR